MALPQAWAAAAPTITSLTITSAGSDVTSVTAGTVVTVTATVVSGSTPVNPGQVKFCDASAKYCEDSALLATAQLTTAGTATCRFRPGIGSHSYQAVFVGTSSYAKSASNNAALTVTMTGGPYPTATTIDWSGMVGDYTLTATVGRAGTSSLSPTGEVSFIDTTDGNGVLGTAVLGTTAGRNFGTVLTSGVGSDPKSVVVADFNGDGIPDLAVTNWGNTTVSVLLGNGDGTFTTKSNSYVGFYVGGAVEGGVVVGDFNGDGIPDLVWGGSGAAPAGAGQAVGLLIGNGDGTFTPGNNLLFYNDASFPYFGAITAGDFNGDGILDIAETATNGNFTVLLGNGDGTFTTKSGNIGNEPLSISAADFNGDGIPDLVVYDGLPGTSRILLGNGDGTFTAKSQNIGGRYVAIGDFNGDGIPDLVAVNPPGSPDSSTIFLGNGDGTFTAKSAPIAGAMVVAVGDFNEDGITDIVTQSPFAGSLDTIAVLLGNGDGTFTAQPAFSFNIGALSFAAGDFNGDGLLDVATLDCTTDDLCARDFVAGSVTVLLNQITETAELDHISVSGTEAHQVFASYPGDAHYLASTSAALSLLAAKMTTTLNLSSSNNPVLSGVPIILTATLAPYSLADFTTDGETVTFYNGGTPIGTGSLLSGEATFETWSLPLGINTLTAVYRDDGNLTAASSNPVAQLVEVVAATPVITPQSATTAGPVTVKITDTTPGATIYYTVNGGLPTTASTVYTGPFTVNLSSSTTAENVLAIAVAPLYAPSAFASASYYFEAAAAQPLISPPSGAYTSPQSVTITDATPGATIYYTTNGTVPNWSSPIFNAANPIPVGSTQTIKALVVVSGDLTSPEAVAYYTIAATTPVFSLPYGYYLSTQQVTIGDATPGATIYYTTDGTTPTTSSPVYMTGSMITIDKLETLKAIAIAPNLSPSAVDAVKYDVAPPVAQPIFNHPSGSYTGPLMVTITDAMPGATIYYTTDGTTPNRSSQVFNIGSPITVSTTEIIKALAVAPGNSTSPEGVAVYTITP